MVGQVGSQLHGLFCSAHLAHLAEAEIGAVLVMAAELAWVKVIEQGGVCHMLPLQEVEESPASGWLSPSFIDCCSTLEMK